MKPHLFKILIALASVAGLSLLPAAFAKTPAPGPSPTPAASPSPAPGDSANPAKPQDQQHRWRGGNRADGWGYRKFDRGDRDGGYHHHGFCSGKCGHGCGNRGFHRGDRDGGHRHHGFGRDGRADARQYNGGGERFRHQGWNRPEGNPLAHLVTALNLTDEQKAKVQPILDQAKPQLQAIRQDAMSKSKAVIQNTNNQIKSILTPEQQQKLDQLQQRSEPSATPPSDSQQPAKS